MIKLLLIRNDRKLFIQLDKARIQNSILLIAIFFISILRVASAQPLIEEQQRLNFGTLAIKSNSSISRYNYPRTGVNATIEGQFVRISSGTTGSYRFTGFPASTTLSVSVTSTVLTAGPSGITESLSVDNYDVINVVTDSQGIAELSMGARLNTSGNNGNYADALYSGTTVIRVDYWQPDVGQYVFNTQTIDIESELRSVLTIDENQKLNFGTLFARSSNTDQAVMTLSPNGTFAISEPGDTRLVSLVKPDQGVFRVSGAAANYSLTITPQNTDVLLEHKDNPGSSPHFILSDLVTTPDITGTTDINGELLIQVGGSLKTEVTASPEVYPSGQYDGIYELTVSY